MGKLNVVIPSVDVEVDGAKYRKVERKAVAGDIIKVTDEDAPSYVTDGGFYAVDSVDWCNDPQITDNDGDEYDTSDLIYEVYEKVTEAPTKYREVKRKADVGERIKIVAAEGTFDMYSNGDEFVVDRLSSFGAEVNAVRSDGPGNRDGYIAEREYVVLEPIAEPTKSTQPERLKVGEYAKVIDARGSGSAKVGDIGIVTDADWGGYGDIADIKTMDGREYGMCYERFIRATDAEVAAAKKAAEEAATKPAPKFEVGEKVRIIRSQSNWPVGTIVTIKKFVAANSISATDGHITYLANINAIEKLSAEEIAKLAEEDEKQREEQRWNAIGRKVGEYKKGDVVRGKRLNGGKECILATHDGTPVDYRGNHGVYDVELVFRAIDGQSIELIAPVESLFNVSSEGDERK